MKTKISTFYLLLTFTVITVTGFAKEEIQTDKQLKRKEHEDLVLDLSFKIMRVIYVVQDVFFGAYQIRRKHSLNRNL